MKQSMLTTIDNPFDPFTQYDEWLACDEDLSRINDRPTTNGYLARIVKTSDELSQEDEDLAIEEAIDRIIKLDPLGIYMRATMDYDNKN